MERDHSGKNIYINQALKIQLFEQRITRTVTKKNQRIIHTSTIMFNNRWYKYQKKKELIYAIPT